jgi:hypothetical protein
MLARKQTSARISKLGGKYLGATNDELLKVPLIVIFDALRSFAASAVSQDETKGQDHKPR